MLYRIVLESLARRRRRKLLSVLAVALGITVTVAVATLALDVGDKVGRELRSFGANLAVTPAADGLTVAVGGIDYRPAGAGAFLPESALVSLKNISGGITLWTLRRSSPFPRPSMDTEWW